MGKHLNLEENTYLKALIDVGLSYIKIKEIFKKKFLRGISSWVITDRPPHLHTPPPIYKYLMFIYILKML